MSKKRISIPVFIAVCVFLVIITFQITFLVVSQMYRGDIADANADGVKVAWESKMEYIDALVQMYYLKEIPLETLEDVLPAAYLAALNDKYTYYLTKEQYESLTADFDADMQGIGVNIIYNNEYRGSKRYERQSRPRKRR